MPQDPVEARSRDAPAATVQRGHCGRGRGGRHRSGQGGSGIERQQIQPSGSAHHAPVQQIAQGGICRHYQRALAHRVT